MKYLKIFGLLCVVAAISFVIINFDSPRLNGDKEQDLVVELNKRLDSLQAKIEEEQMQYAKLDSAEKALDSVSIKMQELQKEKDLLQWRVDSAKIIDRMKDSLNIIATKAKEFRKDSIIMLKAEIDSISLKKQMAMDSLSVLEANYIASDSKNVVEKNRYDSLQAELYRVRDQYVQEQKAITEQIRQMEEKRVADSIAKDSILKAVLYEIETKRPNRVTDEKRKQAAIAQMNYCINAIYKIKSYPSLDFYKNLYDEMDDNLTTEDIKEMPEIKDYRQEIRRNLYNLIKNAEDKNMYMEILAIRKKTKKIQAIKGALNVPMSPGAGNPYAMIFNGILTIARTAADLAVAKYEDDIEFKQDMYAFDSDEREYHYLLQISQKEYIWEIFNKYDLEEYDKQTGNTIEEYYEVITSERRRARLEKDSLKFKTIPDYYYDLGMAYLDEDIETGYDKAKPCFEKYLSQPTVIKIDNKKGIIALTQIIYDTSLDNASIIEKVELVKYHLPKNEMASFLCVKKLYDIEEKELAFTRLYESIDDIEEDEVLIALAMKYFKEIKNNSEMQHIYTELCESLKASESLTLTQYLACLIDIDTNERNTKLPQIFSIKEEESNHYIIKNNYDFKGAFISDSIEIFYEKVNGNIIDIYECETRRNTITEEKLLEELPFLKKNTLAIPCFYEAVDKNGKIRMAKYVSDKYTTYKNHSNMQGRDSCFALLDSHHGNLYYLRNNISCKNNYAEHERIKNEGIKERDIINQKIKNVEEAANPKINSLRQLLDSINKEMDEVRDDADYKTQEEYDEASKAWWRVGKIIPKDSKKYLDLQKDSICIKDSIRILISKRDLIISQLMESRKNVDNIINGSPSHNMVVSKYENGTFYGRKRCYTPNIQQRGGNGEYISIILKDEHRYFDSILLTYKLQPDGNFKFFSSQHVNGQMYRKYQEDNSQYTIFNMLK